MSQGQRATRAPPGPATGAASGDLTGNYPAPTIANGVVTPAKLSSVPAARVGLVVGTPQPVPSDGSNWTIVAFNTVDFDTANLYAPTAQTRLTAPVAGLCTVSAGVRWNNNANGLRNVAICVNGDTSACDFAKNVAVTEVGAVADGGAHLTQENASTLVRLSAGDTVSVALGQDSGAPLNIQGEPATFLSALWVGHG